MNIFNQSCVNEILFLLFVNARRWKYFQLVWHITVTFHCGQETMLFDVARSLSKFAKHRPFYIIYSTYFTLHYVTVINLYCVFDALLLFHFLIYSTYIFYLLFHSTLHRWHIVRIVALYVLLLTYFISYNIVNTFYLLLYSILFIILLMCSTY